MYPSDAKRASLASNIASQHILTHCTYQHISFAHVKHCTKAQSVLPALLHAACRIKAMLSWHSLTRLSLGTCHYLSAAMHQSTAEVCKPPHKQSLISSSVC